MTCLLQKSSVSSVLHFVLTKPSNGVVVVSDYWSIKNDDPPLDVKLGGNNSVLAQRGSVTDGTLVRSCLPVAHHLGH